MRGRTLKVPASVRHFIQHLHPQIKRKVREGLNDILRDPNCGKPLQRELTGYRSLRIGDYRIVYRPDDLGVEVAADGPRKTIYQEVTRLTGSDRH